MFTCTYRGDIENRGIHRRCKHVRGGRGHRGRRGPRRGGRGEHDVHLFYAAILNSDDVFDYVVGLPGVDANAVGMNGLMALHWVFFFFIFTS